MLIEKKIFILVLQWFGGGFRRYHRVHCSIRDEDGDDGDGDLTTLFNGHSTLQIEREI